MSLNNSLYTVPFYSLLLKTHFQSKNTIFHGIVEMFAQQVPWDEFLGCFKASTIKKNASSQA